MPWCSTKKNQVDRGTEREGIVGREDLTEKATLDQSLKGERCEKMSYLKGGSTLDSGRNKCKGPEADCASVLKGTAQKLVCLAISECRSEV